MCPSMHGQSERRTQLRRLGKRLPDAKERLLNAAGGGDEGDDAVQWSNYTLASSTQTCVPRILL